MTKKQISMEHVSLRINLGNCICISFDSKCMKLKCNDISHNLGQRWRSVSQSSFVLANDFGTYIHIQHANTKQTVFWRIQKQTFLTQHCRFSFQHSSEVLCSCIKLLSDEQYSAEVDTSTIKPISYVQL